MPALVLALTVLALSACAHGPHARYQPATPDAGPLKLHIPHEPSEYVDPILRVESRR
jgi:hypothetical protein